MNEEPKSIWKRPIKGWWWFAARLVTLVCLIVVMFFATLFGLTRDQSPPPYLPVVWAVSIGITLVLFFGWPFIRWLCHWRNFRRFLFGVACFVTLIVLVLSEENWRGKRAWDRYLRERTAAGEKFDLAALIPPPVPDEQNLAVCPLLKPVLDFSWTNSTPVGNGSTLRWNDTNGLARLERLDTLWSVRNYFSKAVLDNPSYEDRKSRYRDITRQLEVPGSSITNGWINLALWQAYYRTGTNLDNVDPTNAPSDDVLLALRYLESDLAELKHEAEQRPLARWPVQYDLDTPWGILLPHLGRVKVLCQLLQLRAASHLASGDVEGGMADLDLGFRLADSLRDEPFLISHLVRLVCHDLLVQPLKEGLARHQFSVAQLAELQGKLQSVDLLAGYQRAMRGERAFNGLWAGMTAEGVAEITAGMGSDFAQPLVTFAMFSRVAPKGWIYQNQLAICRLYDDYILPAVNAQARTVHPDRALAAESVIKNAKGPYAMLLHIGLLPTKFFGDVQSWPRKFAQSQTEIDEVLIACALERFRLAHGNYPETLDALVPQFIEKLPHDTIGGQPLKYRRSDDGQFMLYSIGWNETDDRGQIVLNKDGKPDLEKGDWVWQQPVK